MKGIVLLKWIYETIIESVRNNPSQEFFYFLKGKDEGTDYKIDGLYFTHQKGRRTNVIARQPFYQSTSEIIGTVHSHPGRLEPSAADLKTFAKYPVNAIVNYGQIQFFDSNGKKIAYSLIEDNKSTDIDVPDNFSLEMNNQILLKLIVGLLIFLFLSWSLWYLL